MLAENQTQTCHGALRPDVQLTSASYYSLLDFIEDELPRWRDDPERPQESAETTLTGHLCDHLNTAARFREGWDFIQFRTEVVDEANKAGHIDLVPKPLGVRVWVNGKRHNHYDALLPIECKRLPTPTKPSEPREREYVVSEKGHTGGIQRFKVLAHGSRHSLAAMIAYVQDGTPLDAWSSRVSSWVSALALSDAANWSNDDCLTMTNNDLVRRTARLRSIHRRPGHPDIELQHIWVVMSVVPTSSPVGGDACG